MFLACPASSLTVGVAERPLDCATCLPSADLGGTKKQKLNMHLTRWATFRLVLILSSVWAFVSTSWCLRLVVKIYPPITETQAVAWAARSNLNHEAVFLFVFWLFELCECDEIAVVTYSINLCSFPPFKCTLATCDASSAAWWPCSIGFSVFKVCMSQPRIQ